MITGRARLAGLHPAVRERADLALAWADYYGVPVEVTSGFRSWEEQTRLRRNYEQCLASGRFGQGPDCKYPANQPGDSSHNWGLSWDSWTPEEYRSWWIALRRWLGFNVPANDWIHAEVPDWRQFTTRQPGRLVA